LGACSAACENGCPPACDACLEAARSTWSCATLVCALCRRVFCQAAVTAVAMVEGGQHVFCSIVPPCWSNFRVAHVEHPPMQVHLFTHAGLTKRSFCQACMGCRKHLWQGEQRAVIAFGGVDGWRWTKAEVTPLASVRCVVSLRRLSLAAPLVCAPLCLCASICPPVSCVL